MFSCFKCTKAGKNTQWKNVDNFYALLCFFSFLCYDQAGPNLGLLQKGTTMDGRYRDDTIAHIWGDENKLSLWDQVELAIIQARGDLGLIHESVHSTIKQALHTNSADIAWWKAEDRRIHHDLNAYVAERVRCLSLELQQYFHKGNTSYDTQEPAFLMMLRASCNIVQCYAPHLMEVLRRLALQYRHTPMLGRTHGQEAQLQSFGKRVLTWYVELQYALRRFTSYYNEELIYSKLSGTIGNYGGGLSPEIEERALQELGFKPWYGATQIMPRSYYAPLAQLLGNVAEVLGKIALDIRLGARSGRPIYHEPFGKEQTGSSAMPHKKNTIRTEQMEGMVRLARGYVSSIVSGIPTWEERAIEQSCVERVAWPDLFHVVIHMIKTMTKVFDGLVVHPENMLQEIRESRGTYASNDAKGFLAKHLASMDIGPEEAYKIVQLASFQALAPHPCAQTTALESPDAAEGAFRNGWEPLRTDRIQDLIYYGKLETVPTLAISEDTVAIWNDKLTDMFEDPQLADANEWYELFTIRYALKHEPYLFQKVFGVD